MKIKKVNCKKRIITLFLFKACLKWSLVCVWIYMPLNQMYGYKYEKLSGLSPITLDLIH